MARFLVEAYTPATTDIADLEARARRAADLLAQAGGADVDCIFVPADEMCLLIYEAASPQLVRDACRRAGIDCERVLEATGGLEVGSHPSEEKAP